MQIIKHELPEIVTRREMREAINRYLPEAFEELSREVWKTLDSYQPAKPEPVIDFTI